MSSVHPDYNILAGWLIISNHHKTTSASFVKTMKKLCNDIDLDGDINQLISNE